MTSLPIPSPSPSAATSTFASSSTSFTRTTSPASPSESSTSFHPFDASNSTSISRNIPTSVVVTKTESSPFGSSTSIHVAPSSIPTPILETSNQSGLKATQIAAISIAAGLLTLAALAVLTFLCIRRRRHRQLHQSEPSYHDGDRTGMISSVEKYNANDADDEGTLYSDRESFIDDGGGARPLAVHRYSNFHQQDRPVFRDEPEYPFSTFSNGERRTDISAASHPTSTPMVTDNSQLATVAFFPSPHTSLSSISERLDTVTLPPLTIPEYWAPLPARRPSRENSKRSGRGSRYGVADGYETDESASLYSQASASTSTTWLARRASEAANSITTRTILPSRTNSYETEAALASTLTGTRENHQHTSTLRHNSEDVPNDALERQDTLLIATLLKSRNRQITQAADSETPTPSRSSSVVSHIERSGSIRAAPLAGENREAYGLRWSRMKETRDAQRARENRSSIVPELSESSADHGEVVVVRP